jgi:DNA-binding transcriptional LysR family regulator
VTTTVSFASLWVIPRLASFRARHPDVEVYVSADDRLIDLGEARSILRSATWRTRARRKALFGSSASG